MPTSKGRRVDKKNSTHVNKLSGKSSLGVLKNF